MLPQWILEVYVVCNICLSRYNISVIIVSLNQLQHFVSNKKKFSQQLTKMAIVES